MNPTISVIIVNYKTLELTKKAIDSALAQDEATDVIVVDNASGDGSGEQLLEHYSSESRVKVILESDNGGFGAGNNKGAKHSTSEFLFLLNSDAIFHEGCLARLMSHWNTLEKPGIIAPMVYLADGKSPQEDAQGIFPTLGRLLRRETKAVTNSDEPEWVSGCALMIPRTLFDQVGGFDENLFMYFEDVLLCWSIREKGLKIYRVPSAGVTHIGGGSASGSLQKKKQYYSAQDYALARMGMRYPGLLMVKILRWPNWLIGKLRNQT